MPNIFNKVLISMSVYIAEGGHILVALQMPHLFTLPHPHLQNISSDLHELRKWSCAARGEQLLHLLHTSYATGQQTASESRNPDVECPVEEFDVNRRRRRRMSTLTPQNLDQNLNRPDVCLHPLSPSKYAVLAGGWLLYPEFLLRS